MGQSRTEVTPAALVEAIAAFVDARVRDALAVASIGAANDWLTPEQAGEIARRSPKTVTAWCRSGDLPATRRGTHWRIRRADLGAFLNLASREPQAPRLPRVHPDDLRMLLPHQPGETP
jgi:excisionase family DNA binding protein